MLLVEVDIVCGGVVVVKIMLALRTSETATFFLDPSLHHKITSLIFSRHCKQYPDFNI